MHTDNRTTHLVRLRTGVAAVALGVTLASCRGTMVDVAERTRQLYGAAEARPQETKSDLAAGADLDGAIRFGLLNNAGLRAAFERWKAAVERVAQADSLPDPMLGYSHFIEEVQTRTGPQRNRLGLSQTFPWPGKLALRGQVEAEAAEGLWHEVQIARLRVVRDIKKGWFEYGFLAHAIRISRDNLELLSRLEPVVQRRIQGGAGQQDLLRLQVEIGQVENSLESLKKHRPALAARLNAVLNRAPTQPLPLPALAEPAVFEPDSENLRQRLARQNPELAVLREKIDEAEKRRELAALSGWPDVTVGVDWFETGEALNPSTPGSGDDPLAVRVMFNLPIWRGRYSAAEREAARKEAAAGHALVERTNALSVDLAMAIYALDDARRQIALYRHTLLPRARQALEVTQTSYGSAAATLLDVIDSERTLLAFEKAYWRACSDYEQSAADLEALCGGKIR